MKTAIIAITAAALIIMTGCESGLDSDSNVNSEGHTELYADNSYINYQIDESTHIEQYVYNNQIIITNESGIFTNGTEKIEDD
jgi:hypothetical protein